MTYKSAQKGNASVFIILGPLVVITVGLLMAYYFLHVKPAASKGIPPVQINKSLLTQKKSFQELLKSECTFVGTHEKFSNLKFYGLPLSKLPVNLSQSLITKYKITDHLKCDSGGISFEDGNKTGELLLSAHVQTDTGITDEILIGDENSNNAGYLTPQITYKKQYDTWYAPYNLQPYTLTTGEGVKTILNLLVPEPNGYSVNATWPLTFQILTYRELGDLRVLAHKSYEVPIEGEIKTLFLKYAKPDGTLFAAMGFEDEFYATYASSFDKTEPKLKQAIADTVSDVESVSLQ